MGLQSIPRKIINQSMADEYINSCCCEPAGSIWETQKTALGEFEGSSAVVRIADHDNHPNHSNQIMIPTITSNDGSARCISEMVHSCVLGLGSVGRQMGMSEAGGLTEVTRISRVPVHHVPHATSWSQEDCKWNTVVARLGVICLQSEHCRNWGRFKSLRLFCAT